MATFEGHKLIKVGNNWVIDMTEFTGYKVNVNNGEVQSFQPAFRVVYGQNMGDLEFEKYIPIPTGVLRKTKRIIESYLREALLYV